ncbi:MAG: hypothetical protein AB1749_00280 [Pseudomonadota bacterium]
MQARASIIAACAGLALLAVPGRASAFFFCFSFGGDGRPGTSFGGPPAFGPPPYGFAPYGYAPYGPPPFAPYPSYGPAPMTPWQAHSGVAQQAPLPPAMTTPAR